MPKRAKTENSEETAKKILWTALKEVNPMLKLGDITLVHKTRESPFVGRMAGFAIHYVYGPNPPDFTNETTISIGGQKINGERLQKIATALNDALYKGAVGDRSVIGSIEPMPRILYYTEPKDGEKSQLFLYGMIEDLAQMNQAALVKEIKKTVPPLVQK